MKSPFTVTSFLRTSIVYSVNPAYLVLRYEDHLLKLDALNMRE